MKKLILLAAFLYFLIAPLTYHPDNKLVLNWASINNGTNWNIWNASKEELRGNDYFNYPPMHFYLDKIQYFISIPVGASGYNDWLGVPNSTVQNYPSLSRYSLAIKMPIILFGLFAGYLLYLIAKQSGASEKQSKSVAALWLFNPVTLYSIPVMGQNDVMAIVFFLAGWYFLNKKKLLPSTLLFGLGASIKMFPLLWLPFLLLVEKRISLKQKLAVFFGSAFVYVATLLPFISNPIFRQYVFQNGIDRLFFARFSLGFGDRVLLVPILLMLLVTGILEKYNKFSKDKIIAQQATVLLLLNIIFLFFNHFHPQWFAWLVPFWAIWFINQKRENMPYIIFGSGLALAAWGLIITLFNDAALTFGIFATLNPFVNTLPSLKSLLVNKGIDSELFNHYGHTLLVGLGIIFGIYWARDKHIFTGDKLLDINLPKRILKTSKLTKFFSIIVLSILFVFGMTFFANLIPAPLSSKSPTVVSYSVFDKEINQSFVGGFNGLNRIDLYLSDTDLDNLDSFRIIVTDQNEKLVQNHVFSGINVGFKSKLRIELPTQDKSEGIKYNVKIVPPVTSQNPIKVGLTENRNLDSFAYQVYYDKPNGLRYITYSMNETVKQLANLAQQVPFLFIALPILLWFGL